MWSRDAKQDSKAYRREERQEAARGFLVWAQHYFTTYVSPILDEPEASRLDPSITAEYDERAKHWRTIKQLH